MAIINENYFWGELKIGGTNTKQSNIQGNASAEKVSVLTQFIEKYEDEYLEKMFGSTEYPIEIKSYLYNEEKLISPIANYVFCKFILNDETKATASGQKSLTVPNTVQVGEAHRYIRAWNEMVKKNHKIHSVLYNDITFDYHTEILEKICVTDDIYSFVNHLGI